MGHTNNEETGDEISSHLLFVHAIGGCDSTSRLFGIGKGTVLMKLQKDRFFLEQAMVFRDTSPDKDKIIKAGENALVSLYRGKQGDNLNSLRYKRFCEKTILGTSTVAVQTLPPTFSAAQYHSLRVYYQVQTWMGNSNNLRPEDFGWICKDNSLQPLMMSSPPAPDHFISIMRCKCKGICDSKKCTCRKHNLNCTPACSDCCGTSCSNSHSLEETGDDVDFV